MIDIDDGRSESWDSTTFAAEVDGVNERGSSVRLRGERMLDQDETKDQATRKSVLYSYSHITKQADTTHKRGQQKLTPRIVKVSTNKLVSRQRSISRKRYGRPEHDPSDIALTLRCHRAIITARAL